LLLVTALCLMVTSNERSSAESSYRVNCAANLRQIGLAIVVYSNRNHGEYPDTFGRLVLSGDITNEVFVCWSTNDTRSAAPTTRAQAAEIDAGKHVSYIYLGRGMNSQTITTDTVVACEPLSNHGGAGMNVLFGDGHV